MPAQSPMKFVGRIRYDYVIPLVAVVLIVVDLFVKPLTAISVALVVIACIPLAMRRFPELLRSLKSAELPGGLKLEFRESLDAATRKAEDAGLLDQPPSNSRQPTYDIIYNEDPTLALAGLRIAIEQRLRELADTAGVRRGRNLSETFRSLRSAEVLTAEEASVVEDLVPLLNRAVHSTEFSLEAADWAMATGPKLVAGLDSRIERTKQSAQTKRS